MANKVRVGASYFFNPTPFDKINPPFGIADGKLHVGDKVKVINLHGAPKANVMGMCYIGHIKTGLFLGQVQTNSLQKEPVVDETPVVV